MRYLILFIVCLLVSLNTTLAQQEKLLTHFMYDKMNLNPGTTGVDDGISSTMIYRNQWDKIAGAPNSAIFNLEANLNKILVGGVGLSFYHDAFAFIKQNNLVLNYSYPFQIGEAGVLNIGLGLGMVNMSMDPDWVTPSGNTNDVLLPKSASGTNFHINSGLFWKSYKGYYVGLSSTYLNEPSITSLNFGFKRHYFMVAGHRFANIIGEGKDIEIQSLMRSNLIKTAADINMRYFHKSLLYVGLTYRTTESVSFMAGFYPIKNVTLGYSYDLTTNGLNTVSRGSHELVFRYKYIIPEPPLEKSKHPRWL